MSTDRDVAWAACAQALQLELREPKKPLFVCDDPGYMLRILGPRATRPESLEHWMSGRCRGIHVLVTASYSVLGPKRTTVVAVLDPPLLVGLLMIASRKTLRNLEGVRHDLGHPPLDDRFEVRARPGARVRELFAPGEIADLLLRLASAARSVTLTDNIVKVVLGGILTTPDELAPILDAAIEVARRLGEQRMRVPRAPEEWPDDVWRTVAERQALTFDPVRMKISGDVREAPVELRVHTQEGEVYAAIRVALIPWSLGLDLHVHGRNDGADDPADEGEDIELGDAAFDEAFLVHGAHPERVRMLFRDPSIRARALAVLSRAVDLNLRDTHLSSAFRVGIGDGPTLEWFLEELVELALALSRAGGFGHGPYRGA